MNMSYFQVKEKVVELEKFLFIVDNYSPNDFNKWVIKEYAIYNSIPKIIYHARKNSSPYLDDLTPEVIKKIILSDYPNDELHKLIKKNYTKKIRRSK